MRKKSHLSLSHYLLHTMSSKSSDLKKNKHSFYLGSILPDISPSFLYRRHNLESSYSLLKSEIQKLTDTYEKYQKTDAQFWRRLGIITHYLADFFTYPHTCAFHGSFREHCTYENQLKFALRTYLKDNLSKHPAIVAIAVSSVNDIFQMIEDFHREYLTLKSKIEADCEYIAAMCRKVIGAILYLLHKKETEPVFST